MLIEEIEITGHGKAWVSLTPQVDIRLGRLIGGYVNMVPKVGLEGDAVFADGEVKDASFELYGKVDVNAGMSLIFASNKNLPSFNPYNLVDYRWRGCLDESKAVLNVSARPFRNGKSLALRQ